MRRLAFALGTALVLAPAALRAQVAAPPQASPASAEGVVVAIEKDDLVLDLGATRGAAGGDVVEIWRPLKLKHPVTGKTLIDRFLIGRLRLLQVRPTLSLAAPDGTLSRPAETGDIVVPAYARPAPAPPPPRPPGALAPVVAAMPTPVDTEATELSALFDSLRGAGPAARVTAYQRFIGGAPERALRAGPPRRSARLEDPADDRREGRGRRAGDATAALHRRDAAHRAASSRASRCVSR